MNPSKPNTEAAPYRNIHRQFKLNGIGFSRDELKEVAYSLIKEGAPFEKSIGDFLLDWLDGTPVVEVQTSGSTGKPKRIALEKQHMMNSALATGEFFGLLPGNSTLLCLPVDYIAGKMMLVRAMVLGLELDYVAASSDPLAEVSKTYDFCAMVPLQLENSLERLHQIKSLIVGGAPLSDTLKEQLRNPVQLPDRGTQMTTGLLGLPPSDTNQLFTTAVFETYGMTETITHVAVKRVVAPQYLENSGQKTRASSENNPSSIDVDKAIEADNGVGASNTFRSVSSQDTFKALPEVTFSVDARGCLMIDAPKITDTPIVTNDVVRLISETEFQWLGRYDNVINSGGIKLFPERIEAKLASLISARFFVAGIPDEKLGERLVLFIEGESGTEKLLQEIRETERLDAFEVPKQIIQLKEFRMTANGKIRRKKTLSTHIFLIFMA